MNHDGMVELTLRVPRNLSGGDMGRLVAAVMSRFPSMVRQAEEEEDEGRVRTTRIVHPVCPSEQCPQCQEHVSSAYLAGETEGGL